MSENTDSTSPKRGWLIIGGIVSLLAGFFAIAAPGLFSTVITQFLGALLLVTGVVGIFQALFGKNAAHRVLSLLSSVVSVSISSTSRTCCTHDCFASLAASMLCIDRSLLLLMFKITHFPNCPVNGHHFRLPLVLP